MSEQKKKVIVDGNDVKVEDGKLVIANEELANAFESQSFSLDGEEAKNGFCVSISFTKT